MMKSRTLVERNMLLIAIDAPCKIVPINYSRIILHWRLSIPPKYKVRSNKTEEPSTQEKHRR